MSEDRGCSAGAEALDGPSPMPRTPQPVAVGAPTDGRLEAIAQGGHRATDGGRQVPPLCSAVCEDARRTPCGGRPPWPAPEALVERPVGRRERTLPQGVGRHARVRADRPQHGQGQPALAIRAAHPAGMRD